MPAPYLIAFICAVTIVSGAVSGEPSTNEDPLRPFAKAVAEKAQETTEDMTLRFNLGRATGNDLYRWSSRLTRALKRVEAQQVFVKAAQEHWATALKITESINEKNCRQPDIGAYLAGQYYLADAALVLLLARQSRSGPEVRRAKLARLVPAMLMYTEWWQHLDDDMKLRRLEWISDWSVTCFHADDDLASTKDEHVQACKAYIERCKQLVSSNAIYAADPLRCYYEAALGQLADAQLKLLRLQTDGDIDRRQATELKQRRLEAAQRAYEGLQREFGERLSHLDELYCYSARWREWQADSEDNKTQIAASIAHVNRMHAMRLAADSDFQRGALANAEWHATQYYEAEAKLLLADAQHKK
jgi:hypothetical protein